MSPTGPLADRVTAPVPVTIAAPVPIPVAIAATIPDEGARAIEAEQATRRADASVLQTAGQRRINIIWEVTQALIAILVTTAVIYTSLKGIEAKTLEAGFFAIVSTYLARTNHTKVGGVGPHESGR